METFTDVPAEPVDARPQGPRTGRRALINFAIASHVAGPDNNSEPREPVGPKPQGPRRRGGWSGAGVEDAAQPSLQAAVPIPSSPQATSTASMPLSGMSRRKAAQTAAKDSESSLRPEPPAPSMAVEEANTFMDIPDLEAPEDMSRQVAAAPAVRTVSVMDIAELESEDLFRLPMVAKDHEVDLSLLTACLCPADEAAEELVVWDYENLLTEVASELTADREGLVAGSIAHVQH